MHSILHFLCCSCFFLLSLHQLAYFFLLTCYIYCYEFHESVHTVSPLNENDPHSIKCDSMIFHVDVFFFVVHVKLLLSIRISYVELTQSATHSYISLSFFHSDESEYARHVILILITIQRIDLSSRWSSMLYGQKLPILIINNKAMKYTYRFIDLICINVILKN